MAATIAFRDGPAAGRKVELDHRDALHELLVAVEGGRVYVLGAQPATWPVSTHPEWITYRHAENDDDDGVRVYAVVPEEEL